MFSHIKKFLLTPGSGQGDFLFLFRVLIPLVAILDILSLRADLHLFFGAAPELGPPQLYFMQSAVFDYFYPLYAFLETSDFINYVNPWAVYAYLTALVFLAAGCFSRFSAVIALLLQLFIYKSFVNLNYGYDWFMTMSLFYCVIFPVGSSHSVDNYLFGTAPSPKLNYRQILLTHLSIAYFFSGVSKFLGAGWWDGTSVWRAVASVDNNFFATPSIVLLITGIGTIFLELCYPILIRHTRTKYLTLVAVISMHLAIAVTMGLYAFSAIMIAWNVSTNLRISLAKKRAHAYETNTA